MANVTRENLDKRSVKLTIEIPLEESRPFLEEAAREISEHSTIEGFRPGKAPYDIVKAKVGEMKILEAALEPMVRKTFVEAVTSEKLETVGTPEISMEKMAPGNAIVYTATVSLMPEVEKLADYTKLKVEKKDTEVKDSDVDGAIKELQKMQTKEMRAVSGTGAVITDKAVVDLTLKKDKVPVEGGDAMGYQVFLSEPAYIPGFTEQILGMKETETKTFTLPFPKDFYQKHLAGSQVEFTVKLNELFHLENPPVDGAFAASLGMKTVAELKELLKKNIGEEKSHEEAMRQERAVLDAVADASRFSDIPELMVNEEVNKMIHEIEHNVQEQGMDFDNYLKSIGKTIAALKIDFAPQAIQRIKVMVILRALAKEQNVVVDQKVLDAELDAMASRYEDKESKDRIYSPMYREYMEGVLRNRKVIQMLKDAMVK